MERYVFTLHYRIPQEVGVLELSEHLSDAGCTDVIVGTGRGGYFGLQFDREALCMDSAIELAKAEIHRIIPTSTFLSVDEEPCVPIG